jgi:aminoglycoside phosphotransferase
VNTLLINDAALPELKEALDPAAMEPRLRALLDQDARVAAVDVLKYKPGRRCALAYTLRTSSGSTRIFGKLFVTGRGAGISVTQSRIYDALDSARLRIPKPLAYVPELKLLLTEFLDGQLLADQLYRGDTAKAAARMGSALAALHRADVTCAKRWSFEREVSNALKTCAEAGLDDERPAQLMMQARALMASQPVAREVAVHRDYYVDQLFDLNGVTALFDLDDARQGDPALDVGNFLAHLTLRPWQFPELAEACAAARAPFLEAYLQHAPGDRTLLQRVQIYQATSLVRLVGVYSHRPRWADRLTAPLLEAADVALCREDS